MVECKRLSGIGQDAEQQRRLVTGPYGLADATVSWPHTAVPARRTTAGRASPGVPSHGPVERCGSSGRPHPYGGGRATATSRYRPLRPTGAPASGRIGAVPAPTRRPGHPAGDCGSPARRRRATATARHRPIQPTDARRPGTTGHVGAVHNARLDRPAATRSGREPRSAPALDGTPLRACRRARTP